MYEKYQLIKKKNGISEEEEFSDGSDHETE